MTEIKTNSYGLPLNLWICILATALFPARRAEASRSAWKSKSACELELELELEGLSDLPGAKAWASRYADRMGIAGDFLDKLPSLVPSTARSRQSQAIRDSAAEIYRLSGNQILDESSPPDRQLTLLNALADHLKLFGLSSNVGWAREALENNFYLQLNVSAPERKRRPVADVWLAEPRSHWLYRLALALAQAPRPGELRILGRSVEEWSVEGMVVETLGMDARLELVLPPRVVLYPDFDKMVFTDQIVTEHELFHFWQHQQRVVDPSRAWPQHAIVDRSSENPLVRSYFEKRGYFLIEETGAYARDGYLFLPKGMKLQSLTGARAFARAAIKVYKAAQKAGRRADLRFLRQSRLGPQWIEVRVSATQAILLPAPPPQRKFDDYIRDEIETGLRWNERYGDFLTHLIRTEESR